MERQEAAVLLAKITAFDRRTTGEADDVAWSDALTTARVGLREALIAVTEYYTQHREWIMPSDVIRIAHDNRARALKDAGTPDYPPGLTWEQEREWRMVWVQEIAGGSTPAEAQDIADRRFKIERQEISPRPVAQLIAGSRLAKGSRAS